MEKNTYLVILSLLLVSCGSTPDYPCLPAYGCVPHDYFVREDPDPLCKFRKQPTNLEIFEKLLSKNLFVKQQPQIKIPYRYVEPQQAQQPQQVMTIKCSIE